MIKITIAAAFAMLISAFSAFAQPNAVIPYGTGASVDVACQGTSTTVAITWATGPGGCPAYLSLTDVGRMVAAGVTEGWIRGMVAGYPYAVRVDIRNGVAHINPWNKWPGEAGRTFLARTAHDVHAAERRGRSRKVSQPAAHGDSRHAIAAERRAAALAAAEQRRAHQQAATVYHAERRAAAKAARAAHAERAAYAAAQRHVARPLQGQQPRVSGRCPGGCSITLNARTMYVTIEK